MALIGKIMSLFADEAMTIPAFPRTKVKAVSDDNGIGLNALLDAKADVSLLNSKADISLLDSKADVSLLDTKADKSSLDSKQEKHKSTSVSLSVSGWADMKQTVSVAGVTVDNDVTPTPAPQNHIEYCEAGVYCSAQGNGTLTFTCTETPSVDLIVNVLIWN